jgi:hypothetical protein
MQIDWTLSLADVLAYGGIAITLAWTISRRLTKFESTLQVHADTLTQHERVVAETEQEIDCGRETRRHRCSTPLGMG